jgi:SAM-dependent methyltransferase
MKKEVDLKTRVKEFWNDKSCGEIYANGQTGMEYYESQSKARYDLEPYLKPFARFNEGKGKSVLEIGVGMGADHIEWAKSQPHSLTGIDLTPRAIEHTKKRLELYGFTSDVRVADAEQLPFNDNSFDIVYSWGVIHHSPDTEKALQEIHRVLKPGGDARIMIYHYYSIVGYMLWIRYALCRLKPFLPLSTIYARYLESPGTKAFTEAQATAMCSRFTKVSIKIQLSFGDLLQGMVGQRHKGPLLAIVKVLWPRWFIKRFLSHHGGCLFINASK